LLKKVDTPNHYKDPDPVAQLEARKAEYDAKERAHQARSREAIRAKRAAPPAPSARAAPRRAARGGGRRLV
jgi:hypothetical protein